MWDNPRRVTDEIAVLLRDLVQTAQMWNFRLSGHDYDEAANIISGWFNDVMEILEDEPTHHRFIRWFRRYMLDQVNWLESNQRYDIVNLLLLRAGNFYSRIKSQHDEGTALGVSITCRVFITGVLSLLGTEENIFIGTHEGRPLWKETSFICPNEMHDFFQKMPFLTGLTSNLTPSDTFLVPDFREFNLELFHSSSTQTGYLPVSAELIEKAFYGQRYVIDPEGVYVKVTGTADITGLYLKLRSRRNALVDILARIQTVSGDFFTVLTEERLLHLENESDMLPQIGSYAAYVICQVYHDLLTATTIAVEGTSTAPPSSTEERTVSWTVIPRRINGIAHEPRSELPEPVITEPRRVRGHLRKGNMTQRHREELLKFERETGLQVLRFVPPNHTFVRPHISPSTSHEEFATLPRFIRYRIQQALEEAMRQ